MIKFDYIREFVALAENLNFSKTAEQVFITQPALSRHIAELEKQLGAKLLDRDTRNVKLTKAGEAVYQNFSEILRLYYDAQSQAAFLSAGKTGVLTISSPYYWTADFVEPLLLHFQQVNPNCEIKVISCQPQEGMYSMMNGKSDVAVNMLWDESHSLTLRRSFAKEKLSVVLSADHPLAQHDAIELAELSQETIVLLEDDGKGSDRYNSFVLDLLNTRGIKPTTFSYTQQIDTLGMTIKQSGGVCIMPYGVRHMNRSYIRVIPLADDDCLMDMCIFYRADNDNPVLPQLIHACTTVTI